MGVEKKSIFVRQIWNPVLSNLKYNKMKQCSRCKKEKPVEDFYKNKSRPDGLAAECKTCHKISRNPELETDPIRLLKRKHKEESTRLKQRQREELNKAMGLKTCTTCHQTKPLSEFHKRGDSVQSMCTTCRAESNATARDLRQREEYAAYLKTKKLLGY